MWPLLEVRRKFQERVMALRGLSPDYAASKQPTEDTNTSDHAHAADAVQLALLLDSARENNRCERWNRWRNEHPDVPIVLRFAQVAGATLAYADLRKADLRGADFTGCVFNNTKLGGSNLRATRFDFTNVRNTDFHLANLNFTRFIGAQLHDVSSRCLSPTAKSGG